MRKAQCFLRGQFHVHAECFVGLFLMFSSATSPCNEFIWQQKTAHDGKGHRSSSAELWPMQSSSPLDVPSATGLQVAGSAGTHPCPPPPRTTAE